MLRKMRGAGQGEFLNRDPELTSEGTAGRRHPMTWRSRLDESGTRSHRVTKRREKRPLSKIESQKGSRDDDDSICG